MKRQISISTVVVIAAVFLACGVDREMIADVGDAVVDVGTDLRDSSTGDAQAQEGTCSQWEVQRLFYDNVFTRSNTSTTTSDLAHSEPIVIPAGWEPGVASLECTPSKEVWTSPVSSTTTTTLAK